MQQNVDYLGILVLLRLLVKNNMITEIEGKKLAEDIAHRIGANIVVSV